MTDSDLIGLIEQIVYLTSLPQWHAENSCCFRTCPTGPQHRQWAHDLVPAPRQRGARRPPTGVSWLGMLASAAGLVLPVADVLPANCVVVSQAAYWSAWLLPGGVTRETACRIRPYEGRFCKRFLVARSVACELAPATGLRIFFRLAGGLIASGW